MIFTLKLGSDENLPSGKHTKSELEAMAQSKSWIFPAIKW
jgi:hypothetical protein